MSGDDIHEEHEEHVNHEAWVIPYADLLTLLMAMFIALFAMSTVDVSKFKELSIGFNEALGGGELDTGVFDPNNGANGPLDGKGNGDRLVEGGALGPGNQTKSTKLIEALLNNRNDFQVAKSQEQQRFKHLEGDLAKAAERLGFTGNLNLRLEERGLIVTVVTDRVVFDSGSATIKPEGHDLLAVIEAALQKIDNPILIEGHTDSLPISNSVYPSNWELSTGRAGAVARLFESLGLSSARMTPSGQAAKYPIASNATAEGRAQNRRVEIIVQSNLVNETLDDAGLSNRAVDGTGGVSDPVANEINRPIESVAPDLAADIHE